jgi:hypothetical protein
VITFDKKDCATPFRTMTKYTSLVMRPKFASLTCNHLHLNAIATSISYGLLRVGARRIKEGKEAHHFPSQSKSTRMEVGKDCEVIEKGKLHRYHTHHESEPGNVLATAKDRVPDSPSLATSSSTWSRTSALTSLSSKRPRMM